MSPRPPCPSPPSPTSSPATRSTARAISGSDADWMARDQARRSRQPGAGAVERQADGGDARQGGRRKDGAQIAYVRAGMAGELSGDGERLLFMGLWQETAVFALDMEGAADPADGPMEGLGRFEDLRAPSPWGVARGADAADPRPPPRRCSSGRRFHRYCANCGQASATPCRRRLEARLPGPARPSTSARTDPVVIMLPVRGEKCLLGLPGGVAGRACYPRPWPGSWSRASRIEELPRPRGAGRRPGLRKASKVRYHSTQPWPYPSSLMIGLIAEVENDEAAPDQTELEEVRWFTREEARALMQGQPSCPTRAPRARWPSPHQLLIKAWSR